MFDWYSLLSPHVPYLPHWFKNLDLFLFWFPVMISINFWLLILVFSGNVWFYFVSITSSLLISLFLLFSKGCFFTSSGGLRSFEHPSNEVKPVPRVDSSGQVCGATFTVDEETKREPSGMPRVGSAANWSSNYWSCYCFPLQHGCY